MTVPAPKHYWKFDETSGYVASDSAGEAKITLDREDSWVAGRSGKAIRFDKDDGVRVATTTLDEMPAPWTATFWVYRWAATGSASLFSSIDHGLKLQQWNTPEEVGITTFGDKDLSFGVVVPLTEWTHVALVGTPTETKLYLNGKPQGTLPVSIKLGLYWLGSTQGYEEFAKALLDEVKVWDVALTDDQVDEVANGSPQQPATKPPPPPPAPATTIFPLEGDWLCIRKHSVTVTSTFKVSGKDVTVSWSDGTPDTQVTILNPTEIGAPNGTVVGRLTKDPDTITLWYGDDYVEWVWTRPPAQTVFSTIFTLPGTYSKTDAPTYHASIKSTTDQHSVYVDFTRFNPNLKGTAFLLSPTKICFSWDGGVMFGTLVQHPDRILLDDSTHTVHQASLTKITP